jgi:uncharacterized cupredoxin-like copper-binding protein
MRARGRVICALAVGWLGVAFAAAAYAFATGDTAHTPHGPLGPGNAEATLSVNHSRFTPARVVVSEGTTVTFTIVNNDPIGHEFIVGDAAVHAIHEAGTHGQHGAVPGEVSIAPGESATTTYTFDTPGTVLFACHLPGHFAYGMVGDVIVKAT